MTLSCSSSCPAVCAAPSLVSVSFPFVLGFFATGGGTLIPFCTSSASPTTFIEEETSGLFGVAALISTTGLVSVTTFLLLLEKMKLAVLEGDLWMSAGEGGECKLRRGAGTPNDLAAVLRRMASCRFMDGEAVMAEGDLFVEDRAVDGDRGGTTRGWELGKACCEVTMEVGEVDVVVMIRDFLMGF